MGHFLGVDLVVPGLAAVDGVHVKGVAEDEGHPARAYRPEVVVLDIGLPGISGYDVARQLREQPLRETIFELTKAIDSLSGVFANVPTANAPQGLYPYENLKDILKIIGWLGYGDRYTRERADLAHNCIYRLWAEMHYALLQEFDTEVPIRPVSKYLNQGVDLADKLLKDQLAEDDLRLFDSQKRLPTQ